MIEADQFEEVTRIRMGREMDGRVLYRVASYLVDGLLIDTGCAHTAGELADFLEGRGLKLAVNTHHHEDHIGANRVLMERYGIEVFASAESVPLISQARVIPSYRELVWGSPEPTQVERVPETIETDRFRFDVVEIPGHSAGHVALVEASRGWCFSGALGRIEPDGRAALTACIRYLRDLSRRAKELQGQGRDAPAIRDEIFGRETSLVGMSEGDFSAENMIRAVLRADM